MNYCNPLHYADQLVGYETYDMIAVETNTGRLQTFEGSACFLQSREEYVLNS